jgi:hypothetical protein
LQNQSTSKEREVIMAKHTGTASREQAASRIQKQSAKLTPPKKWTVPEIVKEIGEQGLIAKFNVTPGGRKSFAGYFDKYTGKKAVTRVPVLTPDMFVEFEECQSPDATKEKKPVAPKPAAAKESAAAESKKSAKMDKKIKVLVKENPKRAGAAKRYDLYTDGMTVREYIEKGGLMADIWWDEKQKFISLS